MIREHHGKSVGFMLGGALTLVCFVSLFVTAFRQRTFGANGYTQKAHQCWKVFRYNIAFRMLLALGLTLFLSP